MQQPVCRFCAHNQQADALLARDPRGKQMMGVDQRVTFVGGDFGGGGRANNRVVSPAARGGRTEG